MVRIQRIVISAYNSHKLRKIGGIDIVNIIWGGRNQAIHYAGYLQFNSYDSGEDNMAYETLKLLGWTGLERMAIKTLRMI